MYGIFSHNVHKLRKFLSPKPLHVSKRKDVIGNTKIGLISKAQLAN
jgi:hypothetical protein